MSTIPSTVYQVQPPAAHVWYERHLAELTRRCQTYFRGLPLYEREEATAETLASVLKYAIGAAARGKLQVLTPYTLVLFFGRAFLEGRRMAGSSTVDVMSEAAQRKHGFEVISLNGSRDVHKPRRALALCLSEILTDRKADRPAENARRNLDYSYILKRGRASRQVRKLFAFLVRTAGEGQLNHLARELGVSPPRVTALKGELATCLARYGYLPRTARPGAPPQKQRDHPRGRTPARLNRTPLNAGTAPPRRSPALPTCPGPAACPNPLHSVSKARGR